MATVARVVAAPAALALAATPAGLQPGSGRQSVGGQAAPDGRAMATALQDRCMAALAAVAEQVAAANYSGGAGAAGRVLITYEAYVTDVYRFGKLDCPARGYVGYRRGLGRRRQRRIENVELHWRRRRRRSLFPAKQLRGDSRQQLLLCCRRRRNHHKNRGRRFLFRRPIDPPCQRRPLGREQHCERRCWGRRRLWCRRRQVVQVAEVQTQMTLLGPPRRWWWGAGPERRQTATIPAAQPQ